jgi:predicted HAD superfamily Cof-like phosphohydrolase
MKLITGKALKVKEGLYVIPPDGLYPKHMVGKFLNTEEFTYEDTDNNYINKVKEFMNLCEQPVVKQPTIMPEDRNKLRIALIFEELKEYAEASGLEDYFYELSNEALNENGFSTNLYKEDFANERGLVNLTEQLDALCDLQYVLSGTILENGFTNIFDEAFDEVHRSNMSKLVRNNDELLATFNKYKNEDIDVYFGNSNQNPEEDSIFPTPVYRLIDDKVLKSINYSRADLSKFVINK